MDRLGCFLNRLRTVLARPGSDFAQPWSGLGVSGTPMTPPRIPGPTQNCAHGLQESVNFLALLLLFEDARSRADWWRKMLELGASEKGRQPEWALEVGDAVPAPLSPPLQTNLQDRCPNMTRIRILREIPSDHALCPGRGAPRGRRRRRRNGNFQGNYSTHPNCDTCWHVKQACLALIAYPW